MGQNYNDDIRKTVKTKSKKQNNNKGIIIVLAVLICIILAVVLINKNKKSEITNKAIENYNYFVISSGDNFGVIDKTGNVIIEPTYQMIQIPNPEKDIFICMYDYNSEKAQYSSKVLNKDSKEILTNYQNVQAIASNNTSSDNSYQSSIVKYEENDKFGIATLEGKKLTDAIYDSIETLEYKDNLLKVSQGEKYGVIKLNGNVFIPVEYNAILADGYYNSSYDKAGFIVNVKTDKGYRYGYINNDGKAILDTMYTNIKRINEIKDDDNFYLITYKNGLAGLIKNGQTTIQNEYEQIEYDSTSNLVMIQKNAKQGLMDLTGDSVLVPQYENMTFRGLLITATKDGALQVFDTAGVKQSDDSFISMQPINNNEYYIVQDRNNNYGVCSKNKQILINTEYSYIEYAFDNNFVVSKNGKLGLINTSNKLVIDIANDIVQKINGSNLIQTINSETGVSNIYNSKIEKILSGSNLKIYIEDNYIQVISNNDMVYLDFEGNKKDSKDIFTNNTIFAQKKNDKWGYVDKNGNTVVDYIYDLAMDINSNGYGAIYKDGKWGAISKDGTVVKQPTYSLTDARPQFVGEYYKVSNSYEITYYSNK